MLSICSLLLTGHIFCSEVFLFPFDVTNIPPLSYLIFWLYVFGQIYLPFQVRFSYNRKTSSDSVYFFLSEASDGKRLATKPLY